MTKEEFEDICDKAFRRNNIYPLLEIPKPEVKGTIEELINNGNIRDNK